MNSNEFDPRKIYKAIEQFRNGDFHPDRLLENLELAKKYVIQRQRQQLTNPTIDPAPTPVIRGETYALLVKAIECFPAEIGTDPNQRIHLDKVVRPWLMRRFGLTKHEAIVFSIILMEHYFPDFKPANKGERVLGQPEAPKPRRR